TTADGVLIYQEDDINQFSVTQEQVGEALYPQTDIEDAAGAVVTNNGFHEMDPRRYGADSTGVDDSQAAFDAAEAVAAAYGLAEIVEAPGTYKGAEAFTKIPRPTTFTWLPT